MNSLNSFKLWATTSGVSRNSSLAFWLKKSPLSFISMESWCLSNMIFGAFFCQSSYIFCLHITNIGASSLEFVSAVDEAIVSNWIGNTMGICQTIVAIKLAKIESKRDNSLTHKRCQFASFMKIGIISINDKRSKNRDRNRYSFLVSQRATSDSCQLYHRSRYVLMCAYLCAWVYVEQVLRRLTREVKYNVERVCAKAVCCENKITFDRYSRIFLLSPIKLLSFCSDSEKKQKLSFSI